jgi:hypothetical protein
MDAEREREHAGLGEGEIYAAKVVKKNSPTKRGEHKTNHNRSVF